jgi:hypothetical protein
MSYQLTGKDVFQTRKKTIIKLRLFKSEAFWNEWEQLTPEQQAPYERDAKKINQVIDEVSESGQSTYYQS